MPLLTEAEAARGGYPFGDGGQQWTGLAQCRTKPDILAGVQDVGGLWISLDHGRHWVLPPRMGLSSFLNNGVQIDPLDPRRIFIIASDGFLELAGKAGLYATFDGGNTFERKYAYEIGERIPHSPIAYARSSENETLGYATRWYACIPSASRKEQPFLMSDDGGTTWEKARDLSVETFGHPCSMAVDPLDPGKVYLGSPKGLFLFEEADSPAGAIRQLTGSNGLPPGPASSIFVSDNGRILFCGMAGKGVYKSVDGGERWESLYADKALDRLFVNPWNQNYLAIAYGGSADRRYPRFSTDGGKTFAEPSSIEKRPGYTGDLFLVYGLNHAAYHPQDGQLFFVGRQTNIGRAQSFYRSDDGGSTLALSNAGFSGSQHGNWSAPMMFDFADEKRFVLGMIDFKVWLTRNGGRWFEDLNLLPGQLGLKHGTVNGIALHPALDRIVCCVGRSAKGALLVYDHGEWSLPMGTEERAYTFIGYDRDNPDFWYANRYRSTDGGLTWAPMSGLAPGDTVRAMTMSAEGMAAGQAIFTLDAGGSKRIVKRSLDRGETWQAVLKTSYNLLNIPGTANGVFCAHPSDPNALFTIGEQNHIIRKWDLSGGTPDSRPYTDLNIFGAGDPPAEFRAQKIAIDCRYPDHIYVYNTRHGTEYKFLRTTNGGDGPWENLSHLVPDGRCNGLEISPVSGNALVAGSNGMRILKAAYDDPKDFLELHPLRNNLVSGDYMRMQSGASK